jgi:hypothetical protein
MTATTDTKRLQIERNRAARRRLRAGVLRLGGYLGWDRQRVVGFCEATTGRPWRRCDRTALLQVLGAFAEVAACVRAAGHMTPIGGSADPELAGADADAAIGARR